MNNRQSINEAHDRIQIPVDVPNWTENLVIAVSDSGAGIAVWAHWSRIPARPHLWEGVLTVYLPDSVLLMHRSFGKSSVEQAASSGPLTFECVKPLDSWRLSFDGMSRRTSTGEVTDGPLADGPWEPARAEAQFEGTAPTWTASGMDEQEWGDGHLEQPGRISGWVEVAGVRHDFDARGFRDHSYGPRDYSRFSGNTWMTGVFPDGRNVLALSVWSGDPDQPPFAVGFVDGPAGRHAVTGLDIARLSSVSGDPGEFQARITTDAGVEVIGVRQMHRANYSLDTPVGMTLGSRHGEGNFIGTEGPARLTWSGVEADGWIEKNFRTAHLS